MFHTDTGVAMLKRIRSGIFLLLWLLISHDIYSTSRFSFIHITDTHIRSAESQEKLQSALKDIGMLKDRPAFIINTGDLTDLGSAGELRAYRNMIDSSAITVYHLPGNHDIRWSNIGKKQFKDILGPIYQSFDYGSIHFILLDSGLLLEQYGHFSKEQLEWLQADLERVGKEQAIIMAVHHPLFSDDVYIDNEVELLQLINDYNVILFLCGHGHQNKSWGINGFDFLMTRAIKAQDTGYRIIEVNPEREISIYTRELSSPEKQLSFTCSLKRATRPYELSIRSPRTDRKYDDNLPILMRFSPAEQVEMSLDRKNWKPLNRSGGKYFDNFDIKHLSEGSHTLYLKISSENGTWYEFLDFEIDRGQSQLLFTQSTGEGIQSSPVLVKNSIIVGSTNGNLYNSDQLTGAELWRAHTNGPIVSTALVVDDTVFVTSGDGYCYALHLDTGKIIWKSRAGQSIFSSPCHFQDRIYFGSSDSCLYALKSSDGTLLWKFATNGFIKAKPAAEANCIVFGSWDGYFYCVSANDGQLIWKNLISENPYYSAATSNPLIIHQKVIVSSHDHAVRAFDLFSGQIIWERREQENHKPGYSSPAYHDGKVILGSLSGHVFAIDENTGADVWTTPLSDSTDLVFDSSPAIADTMVFVGTIGGHLECFDVADGKNIYSYKLSNHFIFSTPAYRNDGIVYVGSNDGNLYSLKMK